MTTSSNLYTLSYSQAKTYLLVLLFVIGKVALPQLCHLIPSGGAMLLPIYFFTLIAAYKYGWKAGLLTALLSPLANHLLFGMPNAVMLPVVLTKSVLLAVAAGWAAAHFKRVTIPILIAVVLCYQAIGTLAEWAWTGSLAMAWEHLRLAVPGMIIQMVACYFIVGKWLKN